MFYVCKRGRDTERERCEGQGDGENDPLLNYEC